MSADRDRNFGGLKCSICGWTATPSESVMACDPPYNMKDFGAAHRECAREAAAQAIAARASDDFDHFNR